MNENAIREAMAGSVLCDGRVNVEDIVRYAMNDALKLRGQAMSEDVLRASSRKVADVIARDYPSLTDKELELVMEAGVSGELGKDVWVSGASVLQWLRAYYRHASRLAVVEGRSREKASRKMSREEVELLNREAYAQRYASAMEYCREHGTIFDRSRVKDPRAFALPHWAALVYRHHLEAGVIAAPTPNELSAAERRAEKEQEEKQYTLPVSLSAVLAQAEKDDLRDAFLLENHFLTHRE